MEDFERPKSTFVGQLLAMLRRNLLLKKKSIKMTTAELLIPTVFLLEFVLLGVMMQKFKTHYPTVPEFETQPFYYPGFTLPNTTVAFYPVGFTPSNEKTNKIMDDVAAFWLALNSSVLLITRSFKSDADMEHAYLNKTFLGVGLVFQDPQLDILNYTLRFPATMMPPTSKPYIRHNDMTTDCRPKNTTAGVVMPPKMCFTNSYTYTGFASLQNVISTAYMQLKGNLTLKPLTLSTKMLPEEATIEMPGGSAVASLPASYLSNLLCFYVIFLVIYVVTEKEKKHIESMKIMGLRSSVYWISWIFMYASIMLVVSSIALILAKVLSIWPNSNFALLLIDCMLFGCSVIAMGFCIAPFFKRPLIAGLVTYALMNVFGFLYLLETFVPTMTDGARWGMAVLSPTAFFMTMSRVAQAEAAGFGIGFGNAMGSEGFSYGHALIMLATDLVVYSLLAVYLEKVFPSDDTPKQRPWFFFLPSYWMVARGPLPSHTASMTNLFESGDVESVPEELRAKTAIAINGLRKVFPGKTGDAVAVHDFTYECYEDEILAILGHNGAGKTTLINMITGMIAPTTGNALVYGNDVTKPNELDIARTMIGICPQHDILFDTFTVREHIEFYARIKGFSNKAAKLEFERIIDEIGMREQSDVQAQRLSGGQKRRLSISIAVVGNPKILILDEPTSGVDPYSRRFLWDMIRGFRRGRCIIITTQSMQEADVFADRKLIISHGKLRCAGTSLFLKSRFGLGYHLTLAVERDYLEDPITTMVSYHLPGATKTRAHAGELCYILPKSSMGEFPTLFNSLDANLASLKVQSYGVSLTTMEEIFLKLADEDPIELHEFKDSSALQKKREYSRLATSTFAVPEIGAVPASHKFLALAKIRGLLLLRSKLSFIFQILIPFMLIVMNGILSVLAKGWISRLLGTDSLQIEDIGDSFKATGANFFYENDTMRNWDSLISKLSDDGIGFSALNYSDLLNNVPHYAGYIFDNVTGNVPAATICYNSSTIHGIPFSTNLLLNSVYRSLTGNNETFHVATHPFPSDKKNPVEVFDQMFGSMLVSLAVIMIPGVYGIEMCRDRQIKVRSQIRMTGCSLFLYWGSAFVVHVLQFMGSFAMIIALLYAFSVTSLTDAIWVLVALFALHGPVMVLFCYCASFLFTKYETAAVGLPFPLAMIGFILYLVVFMLEAFGENVASEVVHYVFSFVFPCYGFFGAMIYVQKVFVHNMIAPLNGSPLQSYFDWNTDIPVVLVAHAVQIPLLILLIIYLEARFFNQSWLQFLGIRPSVPGGTNFVEVHSISAEDDDVLRERIRVKDVNPHIDSSYAILLRSLWKRFETQSFFQTIKNKFCGSSRIVPSEDKVAVRNLTLVFPKGEIFGLLGPNGAGKTTALSMITGEITPSNGDIHVNGFNMYTETLQALKTMGSCPQTDTLWDDITMEEHLTLFAALNDLPENRSKDSIKTFTEGLYITEHLYKKASALSGGTKRKLTFVISMIGNPPLVLLDEPSTGMDPQSKRNLWDMIMESFTGDRGAILTTHSMEEADALCDRIGIIVKGELRCIGSSQHLKNKFGSGYILEVKLSTPNGIAESEQELAVNRVKEAVKVVLPASECVESFYNRISFAVPKEQISSLGNVFAGLDRVKQEQNLEEYSFGQTTIEQVFLHFAKVQEIPDEPRRLTDSIP